MGSISCSLTVDQHQRFQTISWCHDQDLIMFSNYEMPKGPYQVKCHNECQSNCIVLSIIADYQSADNYMTTWQIMEFHWLYYVYIPQSTKWYHLIISKIFEKPLRTPTANMTILRKLRNLINTDQLNETCFTSPTPTTFQLTPKSAATLQIDLSNH